MVTTAAAGGKVANVVHGCDLQDGHLACGTSSGLVLLIDVAAAGSAMTKVDAVSPAGAPPLTTALAGSEIVDCTGTEGTPAIRELKGHSKIVGFLRIAASSSRLFTSSMDKSVRLWSVLDGTCLQTLKVGTAVLQVALLPRAAADDGDARLLMGCGDGTVRVWDPSCKKASKALTTLRYTHKDYVGELRTTSDGASILSCSRDGAMQLWARDPKASYVPGAVPPRELASSWHVELLPMGLVSINQRGAVLLWRHGNAPPVTLAPESLPIPLSNSLVDSQAWGDAAIPVAMVQMGGQQPEKSDTTKRTGSPDPSIFIAFLGLRDGTGDGRGSATLVLHTLKCAEPPEKALAAGEASSNGSAAAMTDPVDVPHSWERWKTIAAEEGANIDDAALQRRLSTMEEVAAKAGRGELTESTVRNFIKRWTLG